MEETDLISKKELLQLTDISYGQLYRWKRENLIPESWFIKKASFTGQETYFPKDKILKRTSMILELKDKYSLEELAKILSPELTNHSFHVSQLKELKCFHPEVVNIFKGRLGKEYFTFIELIFIAIVSTLYMDTLISRDEIADMTQSIMQWLPGLKDNDYSLLVFQLKLGKLIMLTKRDTSVLMDSKAKIIKSIDLEEVSKDLNLVFSEREVL